MLKVADFDPPHRNWAPPQGVIPVEFRRDLWHQKTRVPGVSCGVVCVILRLAVLVEHRLVTDRQTDGQTDTGPWLRYDTRCYFNVRSKADISQLNLPHGTDN